MLFTIPKLTLHFTIEAYISSKYNHFLFIGSVQISTYLKVKKKTSHENKKRLTNNDPFYRKGTQ